MAEHKYLPCPSHVTVEKGKHKGETWYCEQGNKGHEGTCCGGRSPSEYQFLVREARFKMEGREK